MRRAEAPRGAAPGCTWQEVCPELLDPGGLRCAAFFQKAALRNYCAQFRDRPVAGSRGWFAGLELALRAATRLRL